MELAMIGLGRMGANMTERLVRAGHRVVGYARSAESRKRAVQVGGEAATSLADVMEKLRPPRVIWLMIPAGPTVDQTLEALVPLLGRGDTVVDGGNSYYRDTLRRVTMLEERGLEFVDVGTSGGIWGRTEGYSLMVGGKPEVVGRLRPVFEALAPGRDRGWGHVGPHGAGHFVKMIHNGIEYGMMQALAEGFALLESKQEFELDLKRVANLWQDGSVVRSWLLDLVARALEQDPGLRGIEPWVEDSGEGRWTVQEAVESAVPAPVMALSLMARFRSRQPKSFADRLLAAMRHQFGGHEIKRPGP